MDLRERAKDATRHPWELARATFFTRLILENEADTRRVDILDIGAGDVFFAEHLLKQLPPGSRLVCVDTSYPQEWLGERALNEGRSITLSREVPAGQVFHWVTMLDVLEHVEDDLALLRQQVVPALAEGGRALVSVPAWQRLFTQHDTRLGHMRRYSPSQLDETLRAAGLDSDLKGGLFASLLLPRSLSKLRELAGGHHAAPPTELEDHVETDVGTWAMSKAPTWCIRKALELDASAGLLAARLNLQTPGLSVWSVSSRR